MPAALCRHRGARHRAAHRLRPDRPAAVHRRGDDRGARTAVRVARAGDRRRLRLCRRAARADERRRRQSLERCQTLALEAAERLAAFGLNNVRVVFADALAIPRRASLSTASSFMRLIEPPAARADAAARAGRRPGRGDGGRGRRRTADRPARSRRGGRDRGERARMGAHLHAAGVGHCAGALAPPRARRPPHPRRETRAASLRGEPCLRRFMHNFLTQFADEIFILNPALTRRVQIDTRVQVALGCVKPMSKSAAVFVRRNVVRFALTGLVGIWLSGCSSDTTRFERAGEQSLRQQSLLQSVLDASNDAGGADAEGRLAAAGRQPGYAAPAHPSPVAVSALPTPEPATTGQIRPPV